MVEPVNLFTSQKPPQPYATPGKQVVLDVFYVDVFRRRTGHPTPSYPPIFTMVEDVEENQKNNTIPPHLRHPSPLPSAHPPARSLDSCGCRRPARAWPLPWPLPIQRPRRPLRRSPPESEVE